MKKKELSSYNKADIVITVSEPDKQALLQENKRMQIKIIPNIHETEPLMEINEPHPSLLFVGGFNHPPNVDAVLYFIREILPLIKKRIPEVTLDIVGYSPPQEILALASKDINVTGFVPETRPYLLANRISIAPLRFGAGIKGKIGEAMAYGLPVVTTPVGSEGFGLTHGENILIAETPESFANCVISLLNDHSLYERIRRNGRAFIESNFSPMEMSDKIALIFDQLRNCPVKKIGLLKRIWMKLKWSKN
jgi:glycosyltransferase involved in cell wall biosynthesis